ncbi:MAG: molybdenum cofactor guanylyltransferase [Dehalococcoidia bacterium]|nr:molybdenum cofactor guanylyltransferase [Dehalococcoidia bacterium]
MKSVTAIVLVGGRSTRLGRNKAREIIDGRPIIQRVLDAVQPLADEVLLVAAQGQDTAWPPRGGRIRPIVDVYAESGPLVGIYSGLAAAHLNCCVAVACDMPFLKAKLLQSLVELIPGYDAVVPRLEGRALPLHAVYA